jgi:hypothetical protein
MSTPDVAASPRNSGTRFTGVQRTLLAALSLPLQAAAIFFVAYFLLGGRSRDLHTPLRFGIDSAILMMQSKTTLEHGWWWSNPRLGAPSTLNNLLWPSHSNVDQALLKGVGLVTRELGFTVNVTWLLMLGLAGSSATYCMRLLGAGPASAVVMGTLFALSPYAIYRGLEHFMLVTYLVPFSASLAMLIAAGDARELSRKRRWSLYLGCLLTGFNYAYYALFGTIFLAVGVAAGLLSGARWRAWVPGVIGIGAVVLAVVINVLPSYRAWAIEGRPVTIPQKVPAEAEVYGLKIRHLLSPVWGQTFGPLAAWNKRDAWARFPLETENTGARLGIVAAAGLIGALGCVVAAARVRQTPTGRTALAAGQMTVAGILFATIGGFGVLFNLFVAPDIRAYNRITPFLAFFALFVVALGCDLVMRRSRAAGGVLLAAVLMIGLWDQSFPFAGINAAAAATRDEYRRVESFVREVEAELPTGSRVLELPFMFYLNEPTRVRHVVHDSFKPYLVSQHLRWNYPALSNEQVRWQQAAMKVPEQDLPAVMAREGFAVLWVDKYGYEDLAAALLAKLQATPGAELSWVTERYAVIDIRAVQAPPGRVLPAISAEPRPSTTSLSPCPVPPIASIEYVGGMPGPFDVAVPWRADRDLRVAGWLVPGDKSGVAAGVDVVLDGQLLHAYYGFPRQDVAAYFGGADYHDAGFVAIVPGALLTPGAHQLSFRAASRNGGCAGETPAIMLAVQ